MVLCVYLRDQNLGEVMNLHFMAWMALAIFAANAIAGPIPGVPNELRRQFKSAHKFKVVTKTILGHELEVRIDPVFEKPALISKIPNMKLAKKILNLYIDDVFVYNQFSDGLIISLVATKTS